MNDNKLRINLPKNFIGNALTCPGATLGRFHEDIGIFNHLEEDFFAFFREVVKSYRALVTTFNLLDVGGIANGVTRTRVFQPRYISTPVSHQVSSFRASKLYRSIYCVLLVAISGILLVMQPSAFENDFATLLPKKTSQPAFKSVAIVCMIGFATSVACYHLTAIIPWEEMPTQILTFTIGVFAASIMILLVSVLCSLSKEKASIFKIFPYYLVLVIACLAAFILSSELYILSFIGALCISSLIEVSLIMYFGILMQRGFFSPAVAFTLSVVSAA